LAAVEKMVLHHLLVQALCFGIKPFSFDKHVKGLLQQLEEYLTPDQCK
jgi:hypothetical protein